MACPDCGSSRARPASVDAEEALTQAAGTLAVKAKKWHAEFVKSDLDADYGRYDAWNNAAMLVRRLASGVTLAADRKPDVLRAKVAELVVDLSEEITEARADYALPGPARVAQVSRVAGLSDVRDRLRALLAHPATDQEVGR